MERVIVDTDLLIDYVRGIEAVSLFLEGLSRDARCTTVVNLIELLQGARNKFDLMKLHRFVRGAFHVLMLTPKSSAIAVELIRMHSLADGLRVGDALVAAVTIENGAVLASGNRRHFDNISSLKLMSLPI